VVQEKHHLNKYILDKFAESYQATIASQFSFKILKIDDVMYRLQFWDIAGQDRNPGTTKIFCKDSNGIVLCCEANNKKTLDNTLKWKESLEQNINIENIPIIIVENKCDLLGKSEEEYNKGIEELKKFCAENNIKDCFRTSAMTGYGIEDAMNFLIKEIMDVHDFSEFRVVFDVVLSKALPADRISLANALENVKEIIANRLFKYNTEWNISRIPGSYWGEIGIEFKVDYISLSLDEFSDTLVKINSDLLSSGFLDFCSYYIDHH